MSQTPNFDLNKPTKADSAAIGELNENMDIIDTEMAKPPLTVNETEPDEDRNITITTVPLADNLTSDEAMINTGTYIIRTAGGEASLMDGSAWLSSICGNMTKTGYVAESLEISVTVGDAIEVSYNRATWVSYVDTSGTTNFIYDGTNSVWKVSGSAVTLSDYGITVTGTPADGDTITAVYVKENRGTITTATPTSFVSTGWNLYNHTAGYARVINYSSEYGFMIGGTYTALAFAETLSGTQTAITPVDGFFTLPAGAEGGYVFVTGGNDTDTVIWMTWSDWTETANGGVFAAYTQSTIDLSGVMVDFPDGLMRVGNYYDEINLNTLRAYSRIDKMEYTAENLASVIASGVPYDTDTNYIYYVKTSPATLTIDLSGDYTANDHGLEMFIGTSVPLTATSLYGDDLKGKLRRDVVTISQQDLTAAQQAQVQSNLGLTVANNLTTTSAGSVLDARQGKILKDNRVKYVDTTISLGGVTWTETGGGIYALICDVPSSVVGTVIGISVKDFTQIRATDNITVALRSSNTNTNFIIYSNNNSLKSSAKVAVRIIYIPTI